MSRRRKGRARLAGTNPRAVGTNPRAKKKRRDPKQTGYRALGYETYAEYLNGPEWRKVRNLHLQHYGRICGARTCAAAVVHLHHWTYARIGEERFQDLIGLCADHHEQIHALLRERGERPFGKPLLHATKDVCGDEGPWNPAFKSTKAETKAADKARKRERRRVERSAEKAAMDRRVKERREAIKLDGPQVLRSFVGTAFKAESENWARVERERDLNEKALQKEAKGRGRRGRRGYDVANIRAARGLPGDKPAKQPWET